MRNKYYLVALLILVADHLTKWLAATQLPNNPVELISGYLRLSYVINTGVAFGFFARHSSAWKPYLLSALAIVALMVIYLYSRRMPPERRLLQYALAITMGGILGNFVDRVFRGYVIDFIEFHIHDTFYWPNFKLADSSITIGIALLLIDTVRSPAADGMAEPTGDST